MLFIDNLKLYWTQFYTGPLSYKILFLGKCFTYLAITTFLFRFSLWQYRFQRIFLVLAILCALYYVISSKYVQEYIKNQYKNVFITLGAFIFFTLVGSLTSFLTFQNFLLISEYGNYIYFLFSVCLFILILIFGIEDKKLDRKIFYPFLILYIPFPFLYFISGFTKNLFFDQYGALIGFSNDAAVYAFLLLIPTLYSFFRFYFSKKIIYYITFIISITLILLTTNRGVVLSIFFAIFITSIFVIYKSKNKIKSLLLLLLFLFSSCLISYIIVPKNLIRTNITYNQKIILPLTTNVYPHEERQTLWIQSFHYIIKNPFGYGPLYARVIDIKGSEGHNYASHNTYLQAVLVGGIPLLIILLMIIYIFFHSQYLIYMYNKNAEVYIYLSFFIAVILNSFFSEYLFFVETWIVGALIVLHNKEYKNNIMNLHF